MPFIRHTRDKRGYETTYVMHAYRPLSGPQRTRILYMFRSPAHLKMGRRALDDEAREALEHTHLDVSFDWYSLDAESSAARAEQPRDRGHDRDRDRNRERSGRRRPGPPASTPPPRPVVPVPVVRDDQSLLGRVLGAEQAARLRARYADVQQRILRRGRTPEERDRLTERAQRLNPDDWSDEPTIRVSAKGAEAQWDAILAELPARRRGRRGGRRRLEGGPEASASAPALPDAESSAEDEPSSGLSVIIDEQRGGSDDEVSERGQAAGAGSPTGPAPDGGSVGPERAEPGAVPRDS